MKSVGIVGLPGAGSSTIFTALTSLPGAAPGRSNQAMVPVPDPRVDVLGRLHAARKNVYAQLRFVETSGMVRRGARGAGALSAELLGLLRAADAILAVVRGFGPDADPAAELADLTLEVVYADLEVVTAKVERDRKAARTPEDERAIEAFERARALLDAGTPLRERPWDAPDLAAFQGLALLTLKPQIAVANVDEDHVGKPVPDGVVAVAGALEAEVAGMPPEEARELLASYGLEERGLDRVIRALYQGLDLITFLTAGDKEARAWEVRRGATAPEAAGVIHSDIQRGFIRGDVCGYDDLVAAGGWTQARAKGLVRQEGKAYVMREGDVVDFRFAV